MKASDIMIREFITVSPGSTIKEAVMLLKCGKRGDGKQGGNALVVIDEAGKLAGMITMSHILKAIIPFYMEMAHLAEFAWEGLFEKMCHKVEGRNVSELMERKVAVAGPDMNLIELADLLMKHRCRRLPVVDHGEVVGIVYRKDIFFTIVETMLDEECL